VNITTAATTSAIANGACLLASIDESIRVSFSLGLKLFGRKV
jgi:hypothetical protein